MNIGRIARAGRRTVNVDEAFRSKLQTTRFASKIENEAADMFCSRMRAAQKACQITDRYKNRPKVLVVDTFGINMHGEVIEDIVKGDDRLIKVGRVNCDYESKGNSIKNLHNKLEDVYRMVKQDKSIKAVNLSYSKEVKVSKLGLMLDLPLTEKNIHQYKKTVHDRLMNLAAYYTDKRAEYIALKGKMTAEERKFRKEQLGWIVETAAGKLGNEMRTLEKIISEGVPVYNSAGNSGKGFINIYSFTEGIRNIGALAKDGRKAAYTERHSLVDTYVLGDYEAHFKSDVTGEVVYQLKKEAKPRTCPYKVVQNMPVLKGLRTPNRPLPPNVFLSAAAQNKLKEIKRLVDRGDVYNDRNGYEKIYQAYSRIYDKAGQKLISIKDFALLNDLNRREAREIAKKGNYISLNGNIIVSLDEKRRFLKPEVIVYKEGTSFAAPAAIREDLKKSWLKDIVLAGMERFAQTLKKTYSHSFISNKNNELQL